MENAILTLEQVTGKSRRFHLTDITFSLEPGYIYAVTGPNGAGKSTLFNYIAAENVRYTGRIAFHGMDMREHRAEAMQQIGVVSEDHRFLENRTGKQNAEILGLLYENFDMERFDASMKQMKVSGAVTYKKMSRGERMKFQLAFAIAHGSRLYLLDEATAGLDPVFRIEFFDMLRSLLVDENSCVLMTSHNEAEITRQTDYVAVMRDGKLGAFTESMEGVSYDKN
jgi:ABC-2 type transport system ATP-binding protein